MSKFDVGTVSGLTDQVFAEILCLFKYDEEFESESNVKLIMPVFFPDFGRVGNIPKPLNRESHILY